MTGRMNANELIHSLICRLFLLFFASILSSCFCLPAGDPCGQAKPFLNLPR